MIPFVSVVPMPNNPYDEFLKNLAKMVEEVIRSMPDGRFCQVYRVYHHFRESRRTTGSFLHKPEQQ